jgi:hypothetical protein
MVMFQAMRDVSAAVVITAVLLTQWLNARSIATAATPSADMPPEAPPPA